MTDDRAPVLRRGWTGGDAWRGTRLGLWAWLLQRLAALALAGALVLHLRNPFLRPVQAAVLGLALFHGVLGLRAILLDAGVPVAWHRALFAGALVLAAALFGLVWWWRWY